MKVLVTGANGFIGRHLVRTLAAAEDRVTTIARHGEAPAGSDRHLQGDVRLPECWQSVSGVDVIVHLAGLSDASLSLAQPLEYNAANAFGTLLGLEAARRASAVFVLASSQRVYAPSRSPVNESDLLDPVDPYGYSKLVAEQWVRMYRHLYGLPTVVLRFFSVYGPGQLPGTGASGVVSIFAARALRGDDLVVHGPGVRDFTYVEDVVSGIRRAIASTNAIGEVYNIATGEGTSTQELARQIVAVTGARSVVRTEPRPEGSESHVADIGKARRQLSYQPFVSLIAGLERYVESLSRP